MFRTLNKEEMNSLEKKIEETIKWPEYCSAEYRKACTLGHMPKALLEEQRTKTANDILTTLIVLEGELRYNKVDERLLRVIGASREALEKKLNEEEALDGSLLLKQKRE